MPLFQLNNLYQGVGKQKTNKKRNLLFTISILPDMNIQLVFIIDNGELLHYAKYTVHSLKKKKRKRKKKKHVKWNAACDNYSAQKFYRFGSTMTPAYTHLLYLQIKRNKGT